MTRLTLFAGALLAMSGIAQAQGYFSFGDIPGVDAKPSVQIDLNSAMLGFISAAAMATDPEAAKALEGVSNVRVYVYENLGKDFADVTKFVDDATTKLESDGWHPAVRVNEGTEQVRIYMKPENGAAGSRLSGITIMVTDGSGKKGADESVFINIAGQIEAAALGKLAGALGMGDALKPLGSLGAALTTELGEAEP